MPLRDYADRFPKIVNYLGNARSINRISHSWIFTGDDEISLAALAFAWIQACICKRPTKSGDACGACETCQLWSSGRYPYLYEIKPTSKLRQIVVDEIRDLEHHLFLKTGNKRKIGIIYEADRMAIQAQNAFLKTLEEPTQGTILVLITNNVDGLLPTIKSRCQVISVFNNVYSYDLSGRDQLCDALASMHGGDGATVALSAAERICEMLGGLQHEVEESNQIKEKEIELKKYAESPDIRKKLEARLDALKAANYVTLRNRTISVIHAWYAQQFFLACDIPAHNLPNPELNQQAMLDIDGARNRENSTLRNLLLAEKLVEDLRYNIDLKLAIQNFCQDLCRKDSICN